MDIYKRFLLFGFLLTMNGNIIHGEVCEASNSSAVSKVSTRLGFFCPRLSDAKDEVYCCGNASVHLYCCSNANQSIYHGIKSEFNEGNYVGLISICFYAVVLISIGIVDAVSHYKLSNRRKSRKINHP